MTYSFAKQMSRVLYSNHDDITILMYNYIFVKNNSLFVIEDIFLVLQSTSLETIEVLLGIQGHCQLSICIRCTQYSILEELIRIREDTKFATQQAGYLGTTEKQIYRVSIGYLGKVPKNQVKPYINASTKWQVLMKVFRGEKKVYLYQYPNKKLQMSLLLLNKSFILYQYTKVEELSKDLSYYLYYCKFKILL